MTNKEAIEYLKLFHGYDLPIQEALEIAIEALKQNRWIPCSEKLPEEGDHYICTCKDGYRTMVTYVKWQNKLKRWDLTGARSYWKVIAWMPLPEPYKESED